MKIIDKSIILLILVAVILTSCNGSVSTPAMNPTAVMVTASVTVKPTFTETALPIPTNTLTAMPFPTSSSFPPTQAPFFTFPVDRHDPESVIRAYFDAWARSDSSAMASVLSSKYGQSFMFEPMDSIEILEIQLISDLSSTERIYGVLYDVQWKVQRGSGRVRWNFYLSWDANRDSWIIINYGCC